MLHRDFLAPLGLAFALAAPSAVSGQAVAVPSASQDTDHPIVVGTSTSTSDREATLTFFLADGDRRVLTLRDGDVLLNGRRIATYAADGDVDREWRKFLAWTASLSPDQTVVAGREWAVEGTFDGQDQKALHVIAEQFAHVRPTEAVPAPPAAPAAPELPADVAEAVSEAHEAARIAREEIARVRDQIRVTVHNQTRDRIRVIEEPRAHVSFASPFEALASGVLGLGGAFAALCAIAFGASFFAGRQIDVMADTVSTSFGRSFFVGLFAQPLLLPALGALIVGLALTVVGILLIPVAIVAFAAVFAASVVGGYLAVARVAGSAWMHRVRGDHGSSPLGLLQSIAWGLAIVLAVWLPAVLLGWVPVAGDALLWLAALVTWGLATTGFGAAVLTRGGVRTTFGRRFRPAELPAATLFEQPGSEISTGEWLSGRAR